MNGVHPILYQIDTLSYCITALVWSMLIGFLFAVGRRIYLYNKVEKVKRIIRRNELWERSH